MPEPLLDIERIGVAFWMEEVLLQCEKVQATFRADSVHDLRTALRRCRSMADVLRTIDPHPGWRKMRRAAKLLFGSLGDLRDTHVLQGWVKEIAPEHGPTSRAISQFLIERETTLRKIALLVLKSFDSRQWKQWAEELPARAGKIEVGGPVFAHIALERWNYARELHRNMLRNRTKNSIHQLRVGLKRFRYTLENFLPRLHGPWQDDLKQLQDILGDVHDLDVLWQLMKSLNVFDKQGSQQSWHDRIQEERALRIVSYRNKMVGPDSLWQVWRSALPEVEQIRPLGLRRIATWASFQDLNTRHSQHIAKLSLELFDALSANRSEWRRQIERDLLHAGALAHDAGRSRSNRGHHKVSARLIRKLTPPLGWTKSDIDLIAMIARYHRGALPRPAHRRFAMLSQSRRRVLALLAGILRLACAFDRNHDASVSSLEVCATGPVIEIRAQGYSQYSSLAEHLAAARHLLELALRQPISILPMAADRAYAA